MSRPTPRPLSKLALVLIVSSCSATSSAAALDLTTSNSEIGWWTTVVDNDGTIEPLPPIPDPRLGLIRVKADVFFETGSSTIRPEEVGRLQAVAQQILENGEPVVIVGHTDDVGGPRYNLRLGLDRATTIRDDLLKLRVPDALIFSVDSKGEDCPIKTNATPTGRTANRRVDIYPPDLDPGCQIPTDRTGIGVSTEQESGRRARMRVSCRERGAWDHGC